MAYLYAGKPTIPHQPWFPKEIIMPTEKAVSKRVTTKRDAHAEVWELQKIVRCVTTLVLADRGFDVPQYDADKAYDTLEKWMKYWRTLEPEE